MVEEPNTIFFDTETTGLPVPKAAGLEKQPSIIEYCFIRNGKTLEGLVQPPFQISKRITEITSITNEMLATATVFSRHQKAIAEFCLGGRRWVAHNMNFDSQLMQFELERLGKQFMFPWPIEYYCTLENVRSLPEYVRPKKNNLGVLYEHVTGQKIENQHRAAADVEAMIVVYQWIKKMKAEVAANGQ